MTQYRPEIDGLRALAVLAVIFFHAGFEPFRGGFVGVDVFFVISGYLITGIILAEMRAGDFSLLRFYERRARRILPALFLVLAACLPFGLYWLPPDALRSFSGSLVASLSFSSNFFFWFESGYFDAAAELKPLLHTWSLAVEEQFYLLFPLLLLAIHRLGLRAMAWSMVALAVGSFLVATWWLEHSPHSAFFLLPARAWELLLGALLGLGGRFERLGLEGRAGGEIAGIAGLLLILGSIFLFDEGTPFPGLYAVAPCLGAGLVIVGARPGTWVGRVLAAKWIVAIGLASYSAYLWHYPLFAFSKHIDPAQSSWLLPYLLCAATLALAHLSWRHVEQPFRQRGGAAVHRPIRSLAAAAAGLLALGLLGPVSGEALRGLLGSQVVSLDELKEINRDRVLSVRVDTCHFNKEFSGLGVDGFLAQWSVQSCGDSAGAATTRRIPIVLVGDSHSADKVVALALNGLAPLQMTGVRCSLVPSLMSEDCRKMFDRLRDVLARDGYYRYIALSNNFSSEEMTADAYREMLGYWGSFGRKLILFGGMPRFTRFKEHLAQGLNPSTDLAMAQASGDPALREVLASAGVHFIDTWQVFCAINSCRPRTDDGELLLVDDSHLSVPGARLFGAALVRRDAVFAAQAR